MPIADTIANLILQSGQNQAELAQRRGDIAAQAAARSGQIWQQGFATLADVLNPSKIQAMRDQAAESAQAREMNQIKLDAAKSAQARGAALSKIQQQYGSASPDVMLKALRDQGFTSEATQLEGDLLDLGKKRIDAETADLKNTQEVTQRVIPQVMAITDQASQDAFLQSLPQALQGHDDVQQFVTQALGPTFDPQRVQALAQTGQSFSQIMGARADAAQKLAADASRAKSLADMSRSMFEAGTSVMASSTTPQAWATNREYVVKQFPELARVIPQEFSPEAAAQMRSLAIGPAKEAELAGQAATRAQTKNYQDRMAAAAETRANNAGNKPVGRGVLSGDANRIADFDTSLDDLATLSSTISSPAGGAKATGTSAKIGSMLPNAVTDLTGWGTEAKQKQAIIDRVKQVIGKTLEGGVLRKEDEYKYEKILPTIADTPAVVTTKLNSLRDAITQRRSRLIDSLSDAGYDVSRYGTRAESSTGSASAPQRTDPLGIR